MVRPKTDHQSSLLAFFPVISTFNVGLKVTNPRPRTTSSTEGARQVTCLFRHWKDVYSKILTLLGSITNFSLGLFSISLFYNFFFFFKRRRDRGRRKQETVKQASTQRGAWCRAWSQDSGIMTWTEIKSRMLNQMSFPGNTDSVLKSGGFPLIILPQLSKSINLTMDKPKPK